MKAFAREQHLWRFLAREESLVKEYQMWQTDKEGSLTVRTVKKPETLEKRLFNDSNF